MENVAASLSVVDVAQQLIRYPSVTPNDAGALDYIASLLRPAGFEVVYLPFTQPDGRVISNIYAKIGQGRPAFLFAGHVDVVPTGAPEQWQRDPFGAEISQGYLWGRGAVDMKGGVAASLVAVMQFVKMHKAPQGALGFLITADEEGPATHGTAKVVQWLQEKGEHFDHCLLGEPTNPKYLGEMAKIGRRGSLNLLLRVKGKQGHVAYPHLAQNPIPMLMKALDTLMQAPLDEGTPYFDPSHLEVTSVDVGNQAFNIIPFEACAKLNIRFNNLWTSEQLFAHLMKRLNIIRSEGQLELTIASQPAEAFINEPDEFTDLLVHIVEQETGSKPMLSTSGGTSDARYIRNLCRVVEFGPVGQTMHAIDECISIKDLEQLTHIYYKLICAYFSQANKES